VNDSPARGALLRTVLVETLQLWGVAGRLEGGEVPVIARIVANDGTVITIEQAPEGLPFRWTVACRAAHEARGSAREKRPRPCPSVLGVLNAVRAALGVDRGIAVRVAPAPARAPVQHAVPNSTAWDGLAHANRHPGDGRIPVSILTGFLGSGKTTLLSRLLRHPGMAKTAVVINEFGEIGLDHELLETSDETLVTLSSGCLCCKVRSDLALTLMDLAVRRARGEVPCFERLVIETSGLADPAPILHALAIDPALHEQYVAADVITTADALTGSSTLEHYPESLKQAARADRLVLTKSAVEGAEIEATVARLRKINPRAPLLRSVRGDVDPLLLFGEAPRAGTREVTPALEGVHTHDHSSGISSFTVVRGSLHAATLALFLSVLAENCGSDLLRMKGIVSITEEPDRPAVIHGVQHVYHAPEWLERWPSEDRKTRMVFIGRNVRESWVRAVLELLEVEVEHTLRARSPAPA